MLGSVVIRECWKATGFPFRVQVMEGGGLPKELQITSTLSPSRIVNVACCSSMAVDGGTGQ